MKATSPLVALEVYDASSGMPAAGMAKQMTPPHDSDVIRPPYMSVTNWGISLFASQGAGVFNPYYSTKGAYVLAGSGGHEHPTFFGAAVFNFDDFKWSYLECENPGCPRNDKVVWLADTNGHPWLELLVAPEVPAPPHPYRNMVLLAPEDGGGPLGSVMYVGRGGALGWPDSTGVSHSFDLSTRKWRRRSADENQRVWKNVEGMSLFDPVTKRYYNLPQTPEFYTKEVYLDVADWKTKYTATYSKRLPAGEPGQQAWIQEGGGVRVLMSHRKDKIYGINLDNFAAGWSQVNVTGMAIPRGYAMFDRHEAQGVLYRRLSDQTGNGLYRLIPPSGNPLTGEWKHDMVMLAGDEVAHYVPTQYTGAVQIVMGHYHTLFYVPAFQMMAWITPNGVFMLNP